jgi:hypothetical protein
MVKMATTTDLRQFITDMADGLVVVHEDYTPDPEATAEATARLWHLASLDDEALETALS